MADKKEKRWVFREKIQFMLEPEHTTCIDEIALAVKKATGYKPTRSAIMRFLFDLLTEEKKLAGTITGKEFKKILESYVQDKVKNKRKISLDKKEKHSL